MSAGIRWLLNLDATTRIALKKARSSINAQHGRGPAGRPRGGGKRTRLSFLVTRILCTQLSIDTGGVIPGAAASEYGARGLLVWIGLTVGLTELRMWPKAWAEGAMMSQHATVTDLKTSGAPSRFDYCDYLAWFIFF